MKRALALTALLLALTLAAAVEMKQNKILKPGDSFRRRDGISSISISQRVEGAIKIAHMKSGLEVALGLEGDADGELTFQKNDDGKYDIQLALIRSAKRARALAELEASRTDFNNNDGSSSGIPLGAIIGMAVGGVVLVAVIVAGVVYANKPRDADRYPNRQQKAHSDEALFHVKEETNYADLEKESPYATADMTMHVNPLGSPAGSVRSSKHNALVICAVALLAVAVVQGVSIAPKADVYLYIPESFVQDGCHMSLSLLPGTVLTDETEATKVCDVSRTTSTPAPDPIFTDDDTIEDTDNEGHDDGVELAPDFPADKCHCTGWFPSAPCSEPCGGGTMMDTRQCVRDELGRPCARETQKVKCNVHECPCRCGMWTARGECSATCGGGELEMVRMCSMKDAAPCNTTMMTVPCNEQPCEECKCTEWRAKTQCSRSCGSGKQLMERECPIGKDGNPCDEVEKEAYCNEHDCPCDAKDPSFACEFCSAKTKMGLFKFTDNEVYDFIGSRLQIVEKHMNGFFAHQSSGSKNKICLEPEVPFTVDEAISALINDVTLGKASFTVPDGFQDVLALAEMPGVAVQVDGITPVRLELPVQSKDMHYLNDSDGKRILTLERVRLVMIVDRPKGKTASYGYQLDGNLVIGSVDLALQVKYLNGLKIMTGSSTTAIPVGQLIPQVSAGVSFLDSFRAFMERSGLYDFQISNPELVGRIDSNKNTYAVKFQGSADNPSWGTEAHFELLYGSLDAPTVAFGIQFKGSTISRLVNKILGFGFDGFDFFGDNLYFGFIGSTGAYSPKTYPEMKFEGSVLSTLPVVNGVSIKTVLKFPADCGGDKICEFGKSVFADDGELYMQGIFDLGNKAVSLEAGMGKIPLTEDLMLDKAVLYGKMSAASQEVGIKCELTLQVNDFPGEGGKIEDINPDGAVDQAAVPPPESNGYELVFTGAISLGTKGLKLDMGMRGMWRQAFGFKFLSIGNLHLGIGIVPNIVPSVMEIGGELRIGSGTGPQGHCTFDDLSHLGKCMGGVVYVGVDTITPDHGYLHAEISAVTIGKLFSMVGFGDLIPNDAIKDTGFPKPLIYSVTGRPGGVDLKHVREGFVIPQGMYFKGALNLFNWLECEAEILLRTEEGAFKISGSMEPITIGPWVEFQRSSTDSVNGPHFEIDTIPSKGKFDLMMQGYARIFGAFIEVDVKIAKKHYHLMFDTNLFAGVRATVEATAIYTKILEANFNVYIKIDMTQSWVRQFNNGVIDTIQNGINEATEAIKAAQDAVVKAKQECKEKLELECAGCTKLKCEEAADECDDFLSWETFNPLNWGRRRRSVGHGRVMWEPAPMVENANDVKYRQKRFDLSKAFCDTVAGGGCDLVAGACSGSCGLVNSITSGVCSTLDIATFTLKTVEEVMSWANWVLELIKQYPLFRLDIVEFGAGIKLQGWSLPAHLKGRAKFRMLWADHDSQFDFKFDNLVDNAVEMGKRALAWIKSEHRRRRDLGQEFLEFRREVPDHISAVEF